MTERVVIAHEWLTNIAGSETVLQAMADEYPDAQIVVAVADPDLVREFLPGRHVRSLLSPELPGILTNWTRYAPLILASWARAAVSCDVLLVSSHFGAHRAAMRTDAPSLVYYHSPMRVAWRMDLESGRFPPGVRPIARAAVPVLRAYDQRAARHVDVALANSRATAERVQRAYGLPADVLHPPVAMGPDDADGVGGAVHDDDGYYLYFGRLVAYKRPDLAIAACERLGRRLIVAGRGPLRSTLMAAAGPHTAFRDAQRDEDKWALLAGARALLFPGEEDFGIVPVEAQAVGTPVIGLGQGGLLDSVTDGVSGFLHPAPSVASMVEAILRFEQTPALNSVQLRVSAQQFSRAAFRAGLRARVDALRRTRLG